jgi:hypothetical protein
MVRTLVFFGFLLTHWIAQFMAWSYAEHNPAVCVLWIVLATPLIHLVGSLANQYFWIVASLNSVFWATTLTFVIDRYVLKQQT